MAHSEEADSDECEESSYEQVLDLSAEIMVKGPSWGRSSK